MRNFVVCVVINFCISFVLGYVGYGKLNSLFEGNNNPVTALAAISLFYSFLKMKSVVWINRKVSALASSMLAVYVLHELARTEGLLDFTIFHGDILLVVPVACGVVLSICIIEKVRGFLTRPLTDMINKIVKG